MFRASPALRRLGQSAAPSLAFARPRLAPQVSAIYLTQGKRFASTGGKGDRKDPPPPKQPIDYEKERKIGERKLEASSDVSVESSTRRTFEGAPSAHTRGERDISEGVKEEMGAIKDTFAMGVVPRESRILGLAGTVPYLFTSMSTVYLGWDLAQEWPTGSALKDAFLLNRESAEYLMSVIEPLQLGYGAVIISFLGAIHWGLEYAEKQPLRERTRFRYGIGLAASVVAWPTVLMPVPYALTTQFMAFVALYFADVRATTRGWAPEWYSKYRFLLTAVVGVAILVSLVGRAEIGEKDRLTTDGIRKSLTKEGIADHSTNWAKLEAEEKEKIKKEKEEKEKEEKKKQKKGKGKGKDGEKKDGKEGGKQDDKSGEDEKKGDEGKDDDDSERGDGEEQKDDSKDKDEEGGDDKESKDDKSDDQKDDKQGEQKDDKKGEGKSEDNADNKDDGKDDAKKDDAKDDDANKDDKKSKGKGKGKK